jgi:hypothetical protein
MDWIHSAQDKEHWRTLANIVKNPWIIQNADNFFSSPVTVTLKTSAFCDIMQCSPLAVN